jgi:hypothetical protein
MSVFSLYRIQTKAQETPISDLVELEIVPQQNYTTDDAKNTLKDVVTQNLTVTSEYQIGNQTFTDFLVKQNNDSVENIDQEYRDKRAGFIDKLINSPAQTNTSKKIEEKDGVSALQLNSDTSKKNSS